MAGPWDKWDIRLDGVSRIGVMADRLLSVEYTDREGVESDGCRLTFDDFDGELILPPKRTQAVVTHDGVEIYSGVVDSTPWTLTRGGGRILQVSLKGFDTRGKAVETQLWHLDDANLKTALEKAAALAGVSVSVDPAFAAIERDYWSPQGQSFVEWGERLRREFGATFKMRGGSEAVFAMRGTGQAPNGRALPVVTGRIPEPGHSQGGNVHAVDIDPTRGRPRSKEKRVVFYDRKAAKFEEKRARVVLDDAGDAIDTQRWLGADDGQSEAMAAGQKVDAEQDAGVGQVVMEFTPEAFVEGGFRLVGARPGIDGLYRIAGVTARATRDAGGVSELALAQPSGGAGKDGRKAG